MDRSDIFEGRARFLAVQAMAFGASTCQWLTIASGQESAIISAERLDNGVVIDLITPHVRYARLIATANGISAYSKAPIGADSHKVALQEIQSGPDAQHKLRWSDGLDEDVWIERSEHDDKVVIDSAATTCSILACCQPKVFEEVRAICEVLYAWALGCSAVLEKMQALATLSLLNDVTRNPEGVLVASLINSLQEAIKATGVQAFGSDNKLPCKTIAKGLKQLRENLVPIATYVPFNSPLAKSVLQRKYSCIVRWRAHDEQRIQKIEEVGEGVPEAMMFLP